MPNVDIVALLKNHVLGKEERWGQVKNMNAISNPRTLRGVTTYNDNKSDSDFLLQRQARGLVC